MLFEVVMLFLLVEGVGKWKRVLYGMLTRLVNKKRRSAQLQLYGCRKEEVAEARC